uniref:Uncharacterized protein n=1 Tax=Octopus bimaculoides TaxID=37653 RepID=A0A0L8GC60_OCTBM
MPPHFFSFLTRLFTAFSDHLSSFSDSPFFQPNKRFTIGGVNGDNEFMSRLISLRTSRSLSSPPPFTQTLLPYTHTLTLLHAYT